MSEKRESLNLSAWAVAHPAVILFLIIATTIAGGIAYLNLGRAEDPTFTIKTMVVQVVWPGAKADEMQRLVAEPLEKRLQELPQLDYVRTFSRPNVTVLTVQLRDHLRGRDVADTWYQVRKKLTDSRSELPQGVIGPTFDDEYGDVYAAVYMLTGEGASRADLKRYGEAMRLALLRVQSVAKVALIGDIPQRIFVEISHRKLATLGVSPQVIFDAVARQNAVVASGSIDTAADRVEVRVTGAFDGVAAIRAVPIESGGRVFQLGDIANVVRGYEDPPSYIVEHAGKPALGIAVAIAEKANVLDLGRNLEAAVAAFKETLPTGIVIDQVSNQPNVVAKAVDQFLYSFLEALLIVLAVSFVSLGWRTGIVVALSVPLVLAIVFVIMQVMGLNLDRITLGALIIALGLLVDDAIIAIEMMVVKMEAGFDRIRSATAAWESTAFPMLTGTLVTAAGFLPVGFAQSTAGEYAGNIFWVVAIALVVSWVVAVLFTPYLGMRLLPNVQRHMASHDALYDTRPYRVLRRGVTWSLAHRWRVIAITLAAFAASGVGMMFVQQQFFPTTSRPELFIETRMPEGTAIAVTRQAAEKAAALLKGDDDVVTYTTYVGAGAPRFFFSLNPALPNPAFALTVIMTKGPEARERLKTKLERAVADGAVPQARIRIDRLNFGPPVGFPVQFRVIGPDPLRVREIAGQVRTIVRQNPDTVDVQFDWNEQVKRIEFALNQDRIRAFGLNTADVGLTLQTLLSGAPISEYREGINLIKVVARAPAGERLDIGASERPHHPDQRRTRSPRADRYNLLRLRRTDLVAAQSRHGTDRALGHRARHSGADGDQGDPAETATSERGSARRLSHRYGRGHRGEREGQHGAFQTVPSHVPRDVVAVDVPAPEFLEALSGVLDCATRHHRRSRSAPCFQCAVRFRGPARCYRARRHDHAQHGHSRRSDRSRPGRGSHAMGCHHRKHGATRASGRADGIGCHPRDDPAHAQRLLGAHGHGDDGRPPRRDGTHAAFPACALRRLVPCPPTG